MSKRRILISYSFLLLSIIFIPFLFIQDFFEIVSNYIGLIFKLNLLKSPVVYIFINALGFFSTLFVATIFLTHIYASNKKASLKVLATITVFIILFNSFSSFLVFLFQYILTAGIIRNWIDYILSFFRISTSIINYILYLLIFLIGLLSCKIEKFIKVTLIMTVSIVMSIFTVKYLLTFDTMFMMFISSFLFNMGMPMNIYFNIIDSFTNIMLGLSLSSPLYLFVLINLVISLITIVSISLNNLLKSSKH